jgi:hypothetical protein
VINQTIYLGEPSGLVHAIRWRDPNAHILSPQSYLEQGAYEQAAIAYVLRQEFEAAAAIYEQILRQPKSAAQIYEYAARQAAEQGDDEQQIAILYERAMQLYGIAFDEERAAACRQAVRRYRHLPELIVTRKAEKMFVEYEWNGLTLRAENKGYGPAYNVTLTLRGELDVKRDAIIDSLPATRAAESTLSVRPHAENYGENVPIELVVSYTDAKGFQYEETTQSSIHVWRREDLEVIKKQLELLELHRRTLQIELQKQARHGIDTPPAVIHNIDIARQQIKLIKDSLRAMGFPIADQPNDEAPQAQPYEREQS